MRTLLIAVLVAASAPAYADQNCKAEVDAAFAKLREARSFRLETTITNPDGILRMEADYVLPDRMHQKVRLGKDSPAMEMIVVGNRAWSNQGGGWAELSASFATTVAQQIKETVADAPKVSTDYTCAGDKELEGKSYVLYQGVLDPPAGSVGAGSNQQNVYIDKATGLPVRNIVTPVSAPDRRLFDGTFTIMQDLKIDAPSAAQN